MPESNDYPDVLGHITQQRLMLEMADAALGVRPANIMAGRSFDAVLILQNNLDCDLDAQIRLIIPAKDANGASGRFTTKADKRIVIGLHPAEVGYVSLPILASPQAAPGDRYMIQVEIELKVKERKPSRIRTGGAAFNPDTLSEAVQAQIAELGALSFSAATNGRPLRTGAILVAPFTVNPAALSRVEEPSRAGWNSLWTLHDALEGDALAERARPITAAVLPQLIRQNVFFPLLNATQQRAERAGYRLWAGEATLIAKLLTLTLESGLPAATAEAETAPYPHWFTKLCRVLLQQPDLAQTVVPLVTDVLYSDLIYDAALSAFTIVGTATSENMGTYDEMAEFAAALAKTFQGSGDPLDFIHVYLPLALGGLLTNKRMMMHGEQAVDTPRLLSRARQQREAERDENNQFAFDLTDVVIAQVMAQDDTSQERYLDPIDRMRFKKD